MKRRIIVIMTVILALTGLRIQAQDAMFSQYYANPLYLNPAFAGTNVCPRLAFHFRDQWPSMPGTFMTYTASFDEHFDKISGGVGVLLFGDRAGEGGIINTTDAATVVSVKYVNTAGQVSLKPFKGVNIVVTTHSDGIITTVKEVH